MLDVFKELKTNITLKPKLVNIDNVVAQLHYRFTFWILLTATVLVSSRQYIGEHIRCISGNIPEKVMNTYCFFTATFTVVRHLNNSQVQHPGVGPLDQQEGEDEPTIRHNYYQWVPFVLFGQAIMFYLPHRLWRALEGGTIKQLVNGLEHGYMMLLQDSTQFKKKVSDIQLHFLTRLDLNVYWGYKLMLCELLNALNLLLQFVLTDAFLGGLFLNLGPTVLAARKETDLDPLDVVFPKVTKCVFQKYGPSATIQKHDALCVMALNVMNEKIYTFLWFWFVFLSVATVLGLAWRALTVFCFSRSVRFSELVFRTNGKMDQRDFTTVMMHLKFSHWLFLYYLTKNMHSTASKVLFSDLAREFEVRDKQEGYYPDGSRARGRNGNSYSDDTMPLRPMQVGRAPARSLDVPDGETPPQGSPTTSSGGSGSGSDSGRPHVE